MEIKDIFRDFQDGRMLIKLLECLTNIEIAKPKNFRMRIHKIENINISLDFITKIPHVYDDFKICRCWYDNLILIRSIGAEDIVDGNRKLTLGLIWKIILDFQICKIDTDQSPSSSNDKIRNSKEFFLRWCQRQTAE